MRSVREKQCGREAGDVDVLNLASKVDMEHGLSDMQNEEVDRACS